MYQQRNAQRSEKKKGFLVGAHLLCRMHALRYCDQRKTVRSILRPHRKTFLRMRPSERRTCLRMPRRLCFSHRFNFRYELYLIKCVKLALLLKTHLVWSHRIDKYLLVYKYVRRCCLCCYDKMLCNLPTALISVAVAWGI